jgi:hypothetical protein
MSVCIIYILLSGGVFMSPGCVVDQGVVYPDEIVYTSTLPQAYSDAPVYRSTYRPRVIYTPTWKPNHGGYWSDYPRRYRMPRRGYVSNRPHVVVKKKRIHPRKKRVVVNKYKPRYTKNKNKRKGKKNKKHHGKR